MLKESNTRTDLVKQEAMIAEWKAENGITDTPVVNSNTIPAFTINSSKPKAEPIHQLRPAKNDINHAKQAEYAEKLKAQQAGNLDPVYYYSILDGNKIKRTKRQPRKVIVDSSYQRFKGKYGKLKGSNTGNQILWVLGEHDYIDVDKLVNEHKFNRQTFLNTAKWLEKAGLLKMIKDGSKVVYMERVK